MDTQPLKSDKKIIIFYHSQHMQNTKKLLEGATKNLPYVELEQTPSNITDVSKYDYVGFASGVYFWNFGKTIYEQIERLTGLQNKQFFTIATNGNSFNFYLKRPVPCIEKKGGKYIGGFQCKGWTNYFPLSLCGGVNKNHPNENEMKECENFIKNLDNLNKKEK